MSFTLFLPHRLCHCLACAPIVLANTHVQAAAEAAPLADIVVQAPTRPEQLTGPFQGMVGSASASATKSPQSLHLTPQSITVVTREQMDAQSVSSVAQALAYSSGIVNEYRGSSNRHDEIISRGFRYAPKYLDGLSSTNKTDPWLLERVEMIRGPSSVLYGQINPGGLVSMTSKRPTWQNINQIKIAAGNRQYGELALDVGGALNDDKTVLYRLNGLGSIRNEGIQNSKIQRMAIAPALAYRPNDDTSLTLLSSYQYDPKSGSRNFLPAIGTVFPSSQGYLPMNFNVSDPSHHSAERRQTSIGYAFNHRLNDTVALQQNLRYSRLSEQARYLVFLSAYPHPNDTLLARRPQRERNHINEFGLDNQLSVKWALGPTNHNLLIGLDYKQSSLQRMLWLNHGGPELDIDWHKPNDTLAIRDKDLPLARDNTLDLKQLGLYTQDQITFNQWHLLLSGRYDWSQTDHHNHIRHMVERQRDQHFSGRTGLLYAFDSGVSPYISYSTSFEPNTDQGAPGSPAFKPTTGSQTEVGIKYQSPTQDLLLTLAGYGLSQKNITNYNSETKFNEQIGRISAKGLEAELHAQLTPALDLLATYTYTDVVTKETTRLAQLGKRVSTTPKHATTLWSRYAVQQGTWRGLSTGLGIRHSGSSYGDNEEGFKVAPRTLYDLMLGYQFNQKATHQNGTALQLNVHNLSNKRYVASCNGMRACFYGKSRTISASLNHRW